MSAAADRYLSLRSLFVDFGRPQCDRVRPVEVLPPFAGHDEQALVIVAAPRL